MIGFGNEKTWEIANELANEYMGRSGHEKVKVRFRNLKRCANEALSSLPTSIREKAEHNLEAMKMAEKNFFVDIQNTFAQKIRELCMDKVGVHCKENWNNHITLKGGINKIFNTACREVQTEYDAVPGIYMDAFISAYHHKEQEEVFEILVKLPESMLKRINAKLIDAWDYSICVEKGRLVVHDFD